MTLPSRNPISLPEGVLVDDEDLDLLSQYPKWKISKRGDVISKKQYGHGKSATIFTYKMHRIITNAPKGMDVDHINGNPLDNRRINLRVCTHAENSRNLKIKKNNTSGTSGVYWDKSREKWMASIKLNYKNLYLGRYINKQEAITVRRQAEKLYFGEFARNA